MLTILVLTFGCDQITKSVAQNELTEKPAISFAGDIFRLQYAENNGAFLSMGSNWPESVRFIVLTILPVITLLWIFVYLIWSRNIDSLSFYALALIVGGGASNMVDRVMYDGFVVDFMNIGFGGLRTGIFNFADIFITTGALLIVWQNIREFRLKLK